MEKIKLKNMQEIYSGIDKFGDRWIQFDAGREPFQCCICRNRVESGWLCTHNGDVVCDYHIKREE